jgi:hypothetical protein
MVDFPENSAIMGDMKPNQSTDFAAMGFKYLGTNPRSAPKAQYTIRAGRCLYTEANYDTKEYWDVDSSD